jgi:probable HAF family extracellular repeat protein
MYAVNQRRGPRRVALMFIVAVLATMAACDQEDSILTEPPTRSPLASDVAAVSANVITLPTFGGTWTVATDINDAGQVVGYSYLPGDSIYHAFLWTPGHGMHDLGTLGGTLSSAAAINEHGQVVGVSSIVGPTRRHGFLWTAAHGMQDLGTFGGTASLATDINDLGQVIGYAALESFTVVWEHAFIWTPWSVTPDIGSLGGRYTRPFAINNAGQVVGESQTSFRPYHAFLWTPGHGMQDLGTTSRLEGTGSYASAINDAGQVVGSSDADVGECLGCARHAFRWTTEHGLQDLGALGDALPYSGATGINERGYVVGTSGVGGLSAPFLWTPTYGMMDLASSTGMTVATAINNHDQVAGGGKVATLSFRVPNH